MVNKIMVIGDTHFQILFMLTKIINNQSIRLMEHIIHGR